MQLLFTVQTLAN